MTQNEAGKPVASPSLPIVGIGASAGGLEAFTKLLRTLPAYTGMGFVLVQHLAPSRESMLAEILSRATTMPVMEVRDEPRVEPNSVYVLPPDREMIIAGGSLQLRPRIKDRALSRPIDEFFRSLASDQRQKAIGVILSGTGSDGTLGLEEIKAEGGITFAQDESAQHDGMPHSAIGSGCVDFVLSPEAIADEIARIARHPYIAPDYADAPAADETQQSFGQILKLVRDSSGVDFSSYKESTIGRRINRRMVLKKVDGAADYVRLLRKTPAEIDALYQDILISVTSFFRNPELFEALRNEVLPELFAGRARHDPVRVWAVGCSTGEELYSLAIIFAEFAQSTGNHVPVQFFGTDLNGSGIDKARAGIYAKSIEQDVSEERLARFFSEAGGQYRISKPIRDLCVFAKHNLLSDPPFSRMDLVTCRNLLIYLDPETQAKVMRALHFALKPHGVLALGNSETAGSQRNLFEVRDARHHIYVRKPGASALPVGPSHTSPDAGSAQGRLREAAAGTGMHKEAERLLLARFAPPGVLIDATMDIVQIRGDISPYLAPAPGKASLNLMKMAREGLQTALRAAVQKARKEDVPVRREGLRVQSNGTSREVAVEVFPVRGNAETGGGFLILFEESGQTGARPRIRKGKARPQDAAEQEIARLNEELSNTREYLQSLVEQGEAANEELQSANEEAQSANEELQSVNEELETSKEEIQASNEELATLNDELQNRNALLDQLNNDLSNVIESVRLPMIMVGADLRIRSFTPAAVKVLNLIPADIGRLLGEVKLNLSVPDLGALLSEVIESAAPAPLELEVKDSRGLWYSLRVEPYRTADKRIEGAIVLLVDIDEIKRAKAYAESIVATIREPFLVLDSELRVEMASRSFHQTFGLTPEEIVRRPLFEIGDGQWRHSQLQELLEKVLPEDRSFDNFEIEQTFDRIGRKIMMLNARRLAQEPGGPGSMILLAIEDVTERSQLQRLTDSALANLSLDHLFGEITHRLREALGADRCSILLLGPGDETLRLRTTSGLQHDLDSSFEIPLGQGISGTVAATRASMVVDDIGTIDSAEPVLLRANLKSVAAVPILSGDEVRGVLGIGSKSPRHFNRAEIGLLQLAADRVALAIDRARLLDAERQARRSAEEASEAKDEFFASVSHELRTPMTSILGWTQLLEHAAYDPTTTPEGIRNIDRSARAQARLIDEMLDVARMRSGKLSVRMAPVDIAAVVQNSVAFAAPAAAVKEIRIELAPVSATVCGDAARLEQVFGNLLSNAIKFSPPNTLIVIRIETDEDRVSICVKDEGRGITSEFLPHVFDRFRQHRKGEFGGLGLGLAIAQHLIESQGGTIEVESEGEGKGTKFRVSLPLLGGSETK